MNINIYVENEDSDFLNTIPNHLNYSIHNSEPKGDHFCLTNNNLIYKTKPSEFILDFSSYESRVRKATPKSELLLQILKSDKEKPIIDLTAGLAQESFLLAMKGYKITVIEKSPFLFLLLLYATKKYGIEDKLKLIFSDSINYLNTHEHFSICYADPMFKEGSLSGQVKKEISFLRQYAIHGDPSELIETAKRKSQKMILKMPRKSKIPDHLMPYNYKIESKNTCYYVFLNS